MRRLDRILILLLATSGAARAQFTMPGWKFQKSSGGGSSGGSGGGGDSSAEDRAEAERRREAEERQRREDARQVQEYRQFKQELVERERRGDQLAEEARAFAAFNAAVARREADPDRYLRPLFRAAEARKPKGVMPAGAAAQAACALAAAQMVFSSAGAPSGDIGMVDGRLAAEALAGAFDGGGAPSNCSAAAASVVSVPSVQGRIVLTTEERARLVKQLPSLVSEVPAKERAQAEAEERQRAARAEAERRAAEAKRLADEVRARQAALDQAKQEAQRTADELARQPPPPPPPPKPKGKPAAPEPPTPPPEDDLLARLLRAKAEAERNAGDAEQKLGAATQAAGRASEALKTAQDAAATADQAADRARAANEDARKALRDAVTRLGGGDARP